MIDIIDLEFRGVSLSIAAHLLETSDGPVIIESGPHSTLPTLEKALNQKGYVLEDVKHVFLTHIHLDHAGAAWAFAEHGATIYMHPFGKKHMVNPSKLVASAKMIYKEMMVPLWGLLKPIPENQIVTVKQGDKFLIGDTEIIAWNTPGHAVHHVSYQIGNELVAGDVCGAKIKEDGMVVPPCPPPDINIDHWISSIDFLKQLNLDTVYLSHFGKVTDLEKHFKELEFILWDWANWIRPFYDKKTPPDEIIPFFNDYVRTQLLDYGVPESDLAVYENANPSWMNVRGLLRYWKKKLGD